MLKICPYSYISNHYNLLSSKKHRHKTISYSRKLLKVVKVLYRIGVISNFIVFSKSNINNYSIPTFYIRFTIFFYKNTTFFKKLNILSTPSKKFYISLKILKLSKKIFKSSVIIISTPYGLLTHKEAISLGTGGKLLYVVL